MKEWLIRFAAVPVMAAGTLAAGQLAGATGGVPISSLSFEGVVHQPAQQSSFTLDRTMLAASDAFFNGQDPQARRIAAGLNSVTFRNYHYRDFASYDPAAFAAMSDSLRIAGYQHLVNANAKSSPTTTDLWLRWQNMQVTGVVVLLRGDRNMNSIAVDCNLSPLDLLHLSGHFGIPKVDASAVMVPATPATPHAAALPPVAQPQYGPEPTDNAMPAENTAPMKNPPVLKHHSPDDPQ